MIVVSIKSGIVVLICSIPNCTFIFPQFSQSNFPCEGVWVRERERQREGSICVADSDVGPLSTMQAPYGSRWQAPCSQSVPNAGWRQKATSLSLDGHTDTQTFTTLSGANFGHLTCSATAAVLLVGQKEGNTAQMGVLNIETADIENRIEMLSTHCHFHVQ